MQELTKMAVSGLASALVLFTFNAVFSRSGGKRAQSP